MDAHRQGQISDNSKRIAKNTLLLYFRMLLMMFIGLFTSRVVLQALGVDDYGIYGAVGGVVTVFTFLTNSISSAISRFLAFEIGRSDMDRLKKVFSTSVVMQIAISLLIILLVETAGLWFLNHRMVIPDGRLQAARWVLHCSLGVLVVNLMAVPFNATIIAHEKMSAFAAISIVEAVLKLGVALLLCVSVFDKLETYAVLMLAVALIVRFCYGAYCKRHFAESRGRLAYDGALMKEMSGMAGWNFFGSSAYVFNTQGVNIVTNLFFGVAVNAARGIATQVEGIVKQFVTNFLTALNPQITKTWANGEKEYCFELVGKGIKYAYLVVLAFALPVMFEAEKLLQIWLGTVPEFSAAFVRLVIIGLMADIVTNPLVTLALATGKVRKYYLVTGLVSYTVLPVVWLIFKLGAPAVWAYVVFIAVYFVVFILKLVLMHQQTGFPVMKFLQDVVFPLFKVTLFSALWPYIIWMAMPSGWLRLIVVILVSLLCLAVFTYSIALTGGERAFVLRKIGRFLPDGIFLKEKYHCVFGTRADFHRPLTFNEKVQWSKLYDRNPLYHTLVDKADVKAYVAGKIGEEHVVPTLGVWNSVEEIDWDSLPMQFVLKCTHDSGSTIICTDKAKFDRAEAERKLAAALQTRHYMRDREWAYKGVEPRIIAEQYLGPVVDDWKFFCAYGEPKFMFVATDRSSSVEETKFDFFDMDYNHLDVRNGHPNAAVPPARPEGFEEMKRLAAVLSEGIPQVRVDFYDIGGKIYFGEFTFYHWGGFVKFEPEHWDKVFGEWIG